MNAMAGSSDGSDSPQDNNADFLMGFLTEEQKAMFDMFSSTMNEGKEEDDL